MNVKDSNIYKSLCKSVRKKDHEELLRMLEFVDWGNPKVVGTWGGLKSFHLVSSFWWDETPHGSEYWSELSRRIESAGFTNY